MAYNNPTSKLERAIRAYLIAQGKAEPENIYIANDSRTRALPARTVIAPAFNPRYGHSSEGECSLAIQHVFSAAIDTPETNFSTQRVLMDKMVGDTIDSFACGDRQSLNRVADAITAAGRALATSDGSEQGDIDAADNADMVNFRCDWIKFAHPMLTRGRASEDGTNWVEVVNLTAFVSNADTDNT
mgnify:CR=1 FL=1